VLVRQSWVPFREEPLWWMAAALYKIDCFASVAQNEDDRHYAEVRFAPLAEGTVHSPSDPSFSGVEDNDS